MKEKYITARLELNVVNMTDDQFIIELVNTPGWIKFIGDRNIKTPEDAAAYIKKIVDNPNFTYWVVRLRDDNTSIGVISFIKREYLDHHDIGFAFLPQYQKNGYAYEAANAVLQNVLGNPAYPRVLATTLKDNVKSIHMLEKLGLIFEKEIVNGNDLLLVYGINATQ